MVYPLRSLQEMTPLWLMEDYVGGGCGWTGRGNKSDNSWGRSGVRAWLDLTRGEVVLRDICQVGVGGGELQGHTGATVFHGSPTLLALAMHPECSLWSSRGPLKPVLHYACISILVLVCPVPVPRI